MGSPDEGFDRRDNEILHETSVAAAFELACYQVTNAQYELFDPAHRQLRNELSPEDRGPVIDVSWYDAWAFCRWLGTEYRLPAEKEWEFACRAGTRTAFHYGDSLSWDQANFNGHYPYGDAEDIPYLGRTTPVGSYKPNAWGLNDMHGNVWEWCESWYDDVPQGSDVLQGVGSARVLRGGSFDSRAAWLRSAFRHHRRPAVAASYVGFRVARALQNLNSFSLSSSERAKRAREKVWGRAKAARSLRERLAFHLAMRDACGRLRLRQRACGRI
jgi:formylglycine-generating enzyme required for sulfatase activity